MSFIPYVVEQTGRGERSYDIFSRLLNDRIIMLSEDVNSPPPSLPVPSLWVVSVHQPQASSILYRTWTGDSFHV